MEKQIDTKQILEGFIMAESLIAYYKKEVEDLKTENNTLSDSLRAMRETNANLRMVLSEKNIDHEY